MASVKEFYHAIDNWAPFATQEGFDNAGFLVGRGNAEVSKVLVALDITEEVVAEAVAGKSFTFFHDLRLAVTEAMKQNVMGAMKVFSGIKD